VTLFVSRNRKVGRVLVFNVPIFKTCPGSTALCRSVCYADWSGSRWPSAGRKHEANYQASLRPDFVDRVVAELQDAARRRRRRNVDAKLRVRVHSAGDFYDAEYIRKWVEIATAAPEWTFWAYTRSWRAPGLLPELERLAALSNFWLWLSADRQTKLPPRVPDARGVAWMYVAGENPELSKDDLVFPIKDEERLPVKRIGLAMVCPHYNGTPEPPTCEGCRFCFTAGVAPHDARRGVPAGV
jgi:hypothetical protein